MYLAQQLFLDSHANCRCSLLPRGTNQYSSFILENYTENDWRFMDYTFHITVKLYGFIGFPFPYVISVTH